VLGEARLTDGGGRTARFDTALFLITSNLGTSDRAIGFTGEASTAVPDGSVMPRAVREFFRPEFVNRLTGVLPFQSLPNDAVRQIAEREVAALAMRSGLRHRGLAVEVTDAVLERLVATGYSAEFGARPMQRVVERDIGGAIARHLEQCRKLATAPCWCTSIRQRDVHHHAQRAVSSADPARAGAVALPRPTLTLTRDRASN